MKYRNLLFDLDGTLTDSSEGIIKCAIYTFEKMGIDSTTFDTVVNALGTILIAFGILNNPTDKSSF